MSHPEEFRRYARRCTEIAQQVGSDEAEALSAMARAWVKLAEEEERIADLIRDADNGFAPAHPPAPHGTRLQPAFWDSDRGFH